MVGPADLVDAWSWACGPGWRRGLGLRTWSASGVGLADLVGVGSWACGPGRRRATKRRIFNKTTVSAPPNAAFLLKRVTLRHGVTQIYFGVHHSSSSISQSG